MKKLLSASVMLIGIVAAGVSFSQAANAAVFSVTITVDENGNGTLTNTNPFSAPLPSGLRNDPGPGGLNNVLTYDLLNPPGLVAGDVLLTEPGCEGCLSDVIRFNPNQVGPGRGTGTLVFYSDTSRVDPFNSLADTVSPPTAFYGNLLTIAEVGPESGPNGAIYTPTAGEPGFVAGASGPVTYDIISETPLPSTWLMLLSGFVGLGFFAYRGTKKNSAVLAAA